MRIAAGVLLILTAIFNLFASMGYFGLGIATADKEKTVIHRNDSGNQLRSSRHKRVDKNNDSLEQRIKQLPVTGFGLLAFAMFLLTTVVLLAIAAVFLFSNKQPVFIILTSFAGLFAEGTGIYLFSLGFSNTIGIVGCVLAIIAGIQMRRMAQV